MQKEKKKQATVPKTNARLVDSPLSPWRNHCSLCAVPFPGAAEAEVRRAILGGITDPEARRKRLKNEQRRWHPDRWSGQMMVQWTSI